MTPRGWTVVLVALALAAANGAIQGVRFADTAVFNAEAERDLDRTLRWVTGGAYPAVGPEIHPTSLNLGSMAYLLLAIPVAIDPDPAAVRWLFVLLGSVAVALLFVLLSRMVRLEVAALFGAWLVASELWFDSLRRLWHSSLIPVFLVLVLLALERFLSGRSARWLVPAAGAAAVAVQLHASMAPLALVVGAVFVAHRRRVDWKVGLASAGASLLALVPLVVGIVVGARGGGDPAYARGADVPAPPLAWVAELVGTATTPGYGSRSWLGAAPEVFGVPLLALMLPVLAALGAAWALRHGRGLDLPRVVLALALVGLAMQPTLHGLGTTPIFAPHDLTMRYLHLALVPLLVLGALGTESLLARARGALARGATAGAAVLGAALLALGFVARPSDLADADGGWCRMQRDGAIATAVVEDVGIAAADADRRVHGTYCRSQSTGWRYLYRTRHQDKVRAQAAREQDLHVVVLPAGLDVTPAAAAVERQVDLVAGGESIRLWAVRSAIDYRRLERHVDWSPSAGGGPRAAREVLHVPVQGDVAAVHVSFRAGPGEACPVTASRGVATLTPEPLPPLLAHPERLVRLPLRGTGLLSVTVGPCTLLEAVDVF